MDFIILALAFPETYSGIVWHSLTQCVRQHFRKGVPQSKAWPFIHRLKLLLEPALLEVAAVIYPLGKLLSFFGMVECLGWSSLTVGVADAD